MTERPVTDFRLDVEPRATLAEPEPVPDETFHIAVLGDFSGSGSGFIPGDLVPVPVDRDDVDDVLRRFAPRVRVGGPEEGELEVRLQALDDFHPDRLLETVPLFHSIRDLSAGASTGRPRRPRGGDPSAPPAPIEDMLSGSVLDRIVEGQEGEETGPADPLQRWVDDVVRPDLTAEPGQAERELGAKVGALLSDGMRALLHAPAFQRLEALWRGVDLLVRRTETDARLRIWLVDVSPRALATELDRDQPETSALGELLARGAGDRGERWSVLASTWSFGAGPEEIVTLRRIARLCSASGAAFLAGAHPTLVGLSSLAQATERSAWTEPSPLWQAFRREPEARSVGLALPRILMRVPYGKETDPCEGLELEEDSGEADFADYLWGSPVFALLVLLAAAFRRVGRADLSGAIEPELGDLPLHVRKVGGAQPCTEAVLTEHAADRLLEAGVVPVAWLKGTDRVRLLRVQSVAHPPTRLALGTG